MATKDHLGLGPSTERDGEMSDIEQVAGFLYRNGMPNASRVVRGEVDARNARIAELTAERDRYKSAFDGVMPYVVTGVLDNCGGNKCRDLWCAGCFGEDTAEQNIEKSQAAYAIARNALREVG